MFGLKQAAKRRCRNCANIKIHTGYGVPVCYEMGTLGGKAVATEVSLNDKRAEMCGKYVPGKDEAPELTVTFAKVQSR